MEAFRRGPGLLKTCFGGMKLHMESFQTRLRRSVCALGGPHPQYGLEFPEEIPEKFRKDPGNALRALPGISLESTAGMPQAL